jgi:hypothetical protein
MRGLRLLNKSEEYKESKDDQAYINELINRPAATKPKSSSMQSASTQRILEAHSHGESLVSHKEPLDPSKYLVMKDGEIFVNERRLSVQELVNYEGMRRGAKNQKGESKLSGTSKERKEAAAQAFTCTPPSELTETEKKRLTYIDSIKELTEIKEESNPSFFKKVFDWFFKEENKGTLRRIDLMEDKEEWEKQFKENK